MGPSQRPWGKAAAVAAASLVTLFGIFQGFSPEVILVRGTCAAVMIGLVVRVAVTLGYWLLRSSG